MFKVNNKNSRTKSGWYLLIMALFVCAGTGVFRTQSGVWDGAFCDLLIIQSRNFNSFLNASLASTLQDV